MKVLVTGSSGFIGKNLVTKLKETNSFKILEFSRGEGEAVLKERAHEVDVVVHLAGENRPHDVNRYQENNWVFTRDLCSILSRSGHATRMIFSSSSQVHAENPYGVSKKQAEDEIKEYANFTGNSSTIFRLPNVFGKWCKPHYNSVVATFCSQISKNETIRIDDPNHELRLVYIDDVVDALINVIRNPPKGITWCSVEPEYSVTVGELAETIYAFKRSRITPSTEKIGEGLSRGLYATYISYLSPGEFRYEMLSHRDKRGVFVELLKTSEYGQISYFTAHVGETRGGHYHHTKSEKFLVLHGIAEFRFKNIMTGSIHTVVTSGNRAEMVESIPGWAHDVKNVGDTELVVLVLANEIYDQEKPDTIAYEI